LLDVSWYDDGVPKITVLNMTGKYFEVG